jgi:RNA polymerase sigma-70 factor (ECF subfamily)
VRVTLPGDPAPAIDAGLMAKHIAAVAGSADREAFAELFRYYAPRVKAYLVRQGSDAARAEDLMQDVMATVWRKAGQFDPSRASASAWIFAIARNLRIDVFRRERRPELDPDDPLLVPEAEAPPDAAMLNDEAARRLREALTALPEAEQGVLRMAYFEDKSHARISAELRIPLGTVKSRVRLAFARLRAALGDESEGTP